MKTSASKAAALTLCCVVAALATGPVMAKLPAPSDDAKAKGAEAAAKAAHGGKVANYQLCKSMDQTAASYFAQAKKDGKAVKPAEKSDACAEPGAFVFTPAPAAAAAPAAPAAAQAAAPKK